MLRVENVAGQMGQKARGYANRGRRSEGEETPWQRVVSSRADSSSKVVSSNRAGNSKAASSSSSSSNSRARRSSWDGR